MISLYGLRYSQLYESRWDIARYYVIATGEIKCVINDNAIFFTVLSSSNLDMNSTCQHPKIRFYSIVIYIRLLVASGPIKWQKISAFLFRLLTIRDWCSWRIIDISYGQARIRFSIVIAEKANSSVCAHL